METLDQRLSAAIELRDRLSSEASRIQGRKEAAEHALGAVRAEIKSKNLDPDDLDSTISRLEEAYDKAVETFEAEVSSAETSLMPYMENPDEV
jgi:predicted  nucleic acid-binding Zn-ribbon protein